MIEYVEDGTYFDEDGTEMVRLKPVPGTGKGYPQQTFQATKDPATCWNCGRSRERSPELRFRPWVYPHTKKVVTVCEPCLAYLNRCFSGITTSSQATIENACKGARQ